jgi:two-component system chemotaxis response regulator CheY
MEPQEDLITLRALVIDDSRVMRNMVMQTLRKAELADFEFTEASSGQEGIEKFDPEKIDIIFADWNMPGMDGIEFARYVRSIGWASHIPVIMITSESGEDKQKSAFDQARITCYITKPFTVEDLHEKIAPIIAKIQEKHDEPKATTPAPAAKPAGGGFFSKLLG